MSNLPKLLITRILPDAVVNAAQQYFEVTQRQVNRPMTAAEMGVALAQYEAILPTLGDALGAAVFTGNPRCRMLANFGVGYNHIDIEAAHRAGITVSNTPGAVTDATADITVMLMLMVARRATEGEALVRSGNWQGWHPTQLLGLHLSGKTLGVIGMGRIGQAVARRCHFGFGMEVVFHNRSKVADSTVPGAQQLGSLQAVMAQADVVAICVPGGPENCHLINSAALAAMQPHAVLVNTARGDVVDEMALIQALKNGGIAGAGLDVFEQEPRVPDELLALPNVTVLPHLGTNALEVRSDMGMMAVENLRAFFAGETVPNQL